MADRPRSRGGRPRLVSRARDRVARRRTEPLPDVHAEAAPARRRRAAADTDALCVGRPRVAPRPALLRTLRRAAFPLRDGVRRRAWLDASVAATRALRQEGVPVFGYTWWPLFALVAWAYRQGRRPPAAYLLQMGLWDIDADLDAGLARLRTPLVDAYRELV